MSKEEEKESKKEDWVEGRGMKKVWGGKGKRKAKESKWIKRVNWKIWKKGKRLVIVEGGWE